jgi:hypothetical protein
VRLISLPHWFKNFSAHTNAPALLLPMDNRLKKKIDDILVSLKTWTAPINVLDEEGKPMTVNLAACIGVEKAFDRLILESGKQGTRYYLNGNFQQNDRQFCSNVLYPYIQNIFIDHGQCRIVAKGWEADQNYVVFVCE